MVTTFGSIVQVAPVPVTVISHLSPSVTPPPAGVGILRVDPMSVAAPLPVVVRTSSFFILQEVARSEFTTDVKSAEAPDGIAIRNTAVAV